jgi:hypothetical protein
MSWKVTGSIPDEITGVFNFPNLFSHIIAVVSTQSLTELNTKNPPGGKVQPAHKADSLNTICEPTV